MSKGDVCIGEVSKGSVCIGDVSKGSACIREVSKGAGYRRVYMSCVQELAVC